MSLHVKLNLICVLCPLCINCRVFADFLCSKIKLICAFFILVPATECVALSCKLAWIACVLIFFDYLFSRSCSMSLDIKFNLVGVLCPLRINCCVFADFLCSKIKLICAFFVFVPTTECVSLSRKLSRIARVLIVFDYLFYRSCSMPLNIKLNFVLVYRPLCIDSCILADFLCSKVKLARAFFVLIPTAKCESLSRKLAWIFCIRTRY